MQHIFKKILKIVSKIIDSSYSGWYHSRRHKNVTATEQEERRDEMVNTNELRGAMAKAGYTQRSLAKELGMTPTTLSNKINNKSSFNLGTVEKICSILKIHAPLEKANIFLA